MTFFRWRMWWRTGQSWRSWWTQERCWEHIQVGNNNVNAISLLRNLVITGIWGGDGPGNMDFPHGCLSEYFLNWSVGNYPLQLIGWQHCTELHFSLANSNIVFITVITLAKQYLCMRFAAAPETKCYFNQMWTNHSFQNPDHTISVSYTEYRTVNMNYTDLACTWLACSAAPHDLVLVTKVWQI